MFSLLHLRNGLFVSLLVGMLGMAGCVSTTGHATAEGAAASNAATSADSLAQTGWELTRWVSGAEVNQPIPHGDNGEPIQLVFLAQGNDYKVNGFSGCNRYSGNYRLQDGKLSISIRGNTRMACASQDRAQLEKAYLQALADIRSFTLDSGSAPRHLTFNIKNGDVLEFVRRKDPPTPQ